MSTPLTADQLLAAFDKWHVDYIEDPGWRQRRRDPLHGSWGPVHGGLIHHTGDDAPDSVDTRVLREGRAGLPGPLCNWGMRDDGVLVLLGVGRANHAGVGSAGVLQKIIDETYGLDKLLIPGPDSVDGNARLYGQETMYSGGRPMTKKAYENTLRAWAAVCDAHGWTARSVIGHREWTRRKIDPGSFNLPKFRQQLDKLLAQGPELAILKPTPRITKLRAQIKLVLSSKRSAATRAALLRADRLLAAQERR